MKHKKRTKWVLGCIFYLLEVSGKVEDRIREHVRKRHAKWQGLDKSATWKEIREHIKEKMDKPHHKKGQ